MTALIMKGYRLIPLRCCPPQLYDIAVRQIKIFGSFLVVINEVKTQIVGDDDYIKVGFKI
jgi:hypothetical protein